MRPIIVCFIITLLLSSNTLFSQSTVSASTPSHFGVHALPTRNDLLKLSQELNYVTAFSGFNHPDKLYFEAKVAPNFYTLGSEKAHFGLVITPKVVLRMFNAPSIPVRPPSYMPHFSIYYKPGDPFSQDEPRATYRFYSAGLGHHSNGQEGPFLNSTGAINRINGSFSTNYVKFSVHVARAITSELQMLTFSIKHHPRIWQDPHIRGTFGDTRINIDVHTIHHPPKIITVPSSYIAKRIGLSKLLADPNLVSKFIGRFDAKMSIRASFIVSPLDADITPSIQANQNRMDFDFFFAARHANMENFGIFINLYRGRDYYNINYNRNLTVFRIGIMSDPLGSL